MTGFDRSAFATRWLVAALVLAGVETSLTLGLGFTELLTFPERGLAATGVILAAFGLLGTALALGVGLELATSRLSEKGRTRVRAALAFVAIAALSAPLLWDLTSGRRVKDLALRPVAVVLLTLAFASFGVFANERARSRPSYRLFGTAVLVTLGAEVADVFVLPRLYPSFHTLLALVACGGALVAGRAFPGRPAFVERFERFVPLAVTVAFLLGALAVGRVGRAPITSFVVERYASVTGELVHGMTIALSADEAEPVPTAATTATPLAATAPGIDLRDRDVLLVTVDALRADRLRAYGGSGLTPNMDALAAEGAVFQRAYTSTPHTSYALASLLTGKYLRPVLELPNAPHEHTALPERLRRYGYRTAAFYPPAIFFVDAERFRSLEEAGFGFEYRKQMYASAPERVRQLDSYLGEVPAGNPVFVWVHLFEPHEPYEPPAEFRSGEGDEALYDGEVRATDAALGDLVRSFRARRPTGTVILTADHGEEFGDHGGRYHGSTLYDEQVRVPFVWSSPGAVSARVIENPVEHVDIASTLLAALGVPRDVRMRGDDLGPLLAGATADVPAHAFADIADERMIVDGRYKAICESSTPRCQLYDLRADPRERHNLAGERPAEVERLRTEIARFVASIPRTEAMAMGDQAGWPEALARAELGDRTVAAELEPLLSSGRAEVRSAAARALARLGHAPSLRTLESVAENDPVRAVADEAAVSSVFLGGDRQVERVRVLASSEDGEITLRAALALAGRNDGAGATRLSSCVLDEEFDEVRRRTCVRALGTIRSREGVSSLIRALDDVRLRVDAADALGAIGDRSAASALAAHLAAERYVPPRLSMARALAALGDRRFDSITRRYLGMASGMPGGVGLLLERGRIGAVSATQGDLRGATVRGYACDESGCTVSTDAALPTGAARGERRVVVRVTAADGAIVTLAGQRSGPLPRGESELSVACGDAACAGIPIRVEGDAKLVAYVVVEAVPEIPPPAPEPWDAGVADGAM